MKHHENLKFLENMTLKEKARAKVKELDARMAELNALYDNESDPKKQKELAVGRNLFKRQAGGFLIL